MNILIFFPYNQRTVEQQSVMEMLIKKGHNVILLTLTGKAFLHSYAEKLGIKAFSTNTGESLSIKKIITNTKWLLRLCREYKINTVFIHQQICMLPAIFAQTFLSTKNYYFRHNTDEGYKEHPVKIKWMNKFINRFSKYIVAPSNIVFNYLTQVEKIPAKKIIRINYGYNFNQYEKPNYEISAEVRQRYSCSFLIVSIARLVPAKRHKLMFDVVKQLIVQGKDIKMICLGDGVLKEELQEWIKKNELDQHIFLAGMQINIFDYLLAADILLHLSETEASNSVVKEAGITGLPAIVCKNVGDFSDYIINNENSFLVEKESPVNETIQIVEKLYDEKNRLKEIGDCLKHTVIKKFTIDTVANDYEKLISKL